MSARPEPALTVQKILRAGWQVRVSRLSANSGEQGRICYTEGYGDIYKQRQSACRAEGGSRAHGVAAVCLDARRPFRHAGLVGLDRASCGQMGTRRLQPLENGLRHGLLGRRHPLFPRSVFRRVDRNVLQGVAFLIPARSSLAISGDALHLRQHPRRAAGIREPRG